MAAETSTTIDIFGLTEWNEMIKIASAVLKPTPVGGTIFYIDDTADGTYEFFDVNGNIIENIGVGDKPYAYKVVTPGTKDRYYVYHDELYDMVRWTYTRDTSVYESLGTSNSVGSGKANTETVMTKDSGAYITADTGGSPTIWYQLQQVRNAKVGGCDDWFVPSVDELEELRLAIESGSITGGVIAGSSYRRSVFGRRDFWSSSELDAQNARLWSSSTESWSSDVKDHAYHIFFIRAF